MPHHFIRGRGLLGIIVALLLSTSVAAQPTDASHIAPVTATPEMRRQANEYYQRRDWVKAAQAYAALTQLEPQNANAWYRLGASQAALGQLEPARDTLEKAVALQPNPYFTYGLACVYARLNVKDKSLAALERAVQSGYRQVEQMRTDEDLKNIRHEARFNEILLQAMPCATRPEAAQFDFWLGEWNVTNAQGQPVGTNSIKRILGQCVVLEEYSEHLGGGGKSFNVYDAQRGRWQQTWVDAQGTMLHFVGEFKDGAMRLTGRGQNRVGQPVIYRMSYTPQPDGRVRQLWESSGDEGKTWTVAFDGWYSRKK